MCNKESWDFRAGRTTAQVIFICVYICDGEAERKGEKGEEYETEM